MDKFVTFRKQVYMMLLALSAIIGDQGFFAYPNVRNRYEFHFYKLRVK